MMNVQFYLTELDMPCCAGYLSNSGYCDIIASLSEAFNLSEDIESFYLRYDKEDDIYKILISSFKNIDDSTIHVVESFLLGYSECYVKFQSKIEGKL